MRVQKKPLNRFEERNAQANDFIRATDAIVVHHNANMFDDAMSSTAVFVPQFKSNFGTLAISYCSPKDEFNRKVGKILAVERLSRGEGMLFRIPNYARGDVLATRNIILSILSIISLL